MLLLPGADAQAANVVATRILDAVAKTKIALGPEEKRAITASIGGAVWVPPSGEIGVDVIKRAGEALVTAKLQGRRGLHIEPGTPEKAPG